ncbi:MAG TPA: NUDIX domain-containing protein [Nitrososphaerales archaeon]|nr:NUDIX domain-containing protein [Nitrososphaerales archaeon]
MASKPVKTRVFTTGVVLSRGKLLILKRKDDDDTYPGVWDCVGGHFEQGESADECMLREAKEEAGQKMTIVRSGPLIEFLDEYGRAVAVPFILKLEPKKRIVPSEHSEFRWVRLNEVRKYHIVPDLARALDLFGLVASPTRAKSKSVGRRSGQRD